MPDNLLKNHLPLFGFGGASVGNLYAATTDEVAQSAMEAAMEVGFGYIDTAPHYGHGLSEVRIGKFLANWKGARPAISTKVGRILVPCGPEGPPDYGFVDPLPFTQRFDYSYDGVMRSFDESCARMGVDAVDILFMHDIGQFCHGDDHEDVFAVAMNGGFRAMAELKASGRTRAIGLGVNEWEVCAETFAHANFDVFMLAGRYTLLEQDPLDKFFPECKRRNVGIICAAPFNSGLLARRPDAESKYNYAQVPSEVLDRAIILHSFCEAHGVPVQSAALQFPLLHSVVLSVVTGMSSAERVRTSAEWARHEIPAEFWVAMRDAGLIHPGSLVEPAGVAGASHPLGTTTRGGRNARLP